MKKILLGMMFGQRGYICLTQFMFGTHEVLLNGFWWIEFYTKSRPQWWPKYKQLFSEHVSLCLWVFFFTSYTQQRYVYAVSWGSNTVLKTCSEWDLNLSASNVKHFGRNCAKWKKEEDATFVFLFLLFSFVLLKLDKFNLD